MSVGLGAEFDRFLKQRFGLRVLAHARVGHPEPVGRAGPIRAGRGLLVGDAPLLGGQPQMSVAAVFLRRLQPCADVRVRGGGE